MCEINQFRDTNVRAFCFQVGSKLCWLEDSIQSLRPGRLVTFFFFLFFVCLGVFCFLFFGLLFVCLFLVPGELKGIRSSEWAVWGLRRICRVENNCRLNKTSTLWVMGFAHLVQGNKGKKWFPELWHRCRTRLCWQVCIYHPLWARQCAPVKAATILIFVEAVVWVRILVLPLLSTGPYTGYSPLLRDLISLSVKSGILLVHT